MGDIYSTQVLTGVVNSLRVPPQFLLSTFFPIVLTSTQEEVSFDVAKDSRKLAPFVSPLVEGSIRRERGFTTKTFKPAYIKAKTPLDTLGSLRRSFGEAISGNLSPAQRDEIRVNNTLEDHRKMVESRMEWMAASALKAGTITVAGDGYPSVVVDFGRDAALNIVLSGGSKWTDSGIDPLANLQTWSQLMLTKSGSGGGTVVMDIDAWNVFKKDATVKARLDLQRSLSQAPTMKQDAMFAEGAKLMGNIDGFDIWVYAASYVDDSDAVQLMLPSGTVLMVGQVEGRQQYGAIQDLKAGLQSVPLFSKSWEEEDPSRRIVMTQSAPLVVPYRVNATLSATVL
jgi:hypothetical protein